MKESAAHEDCFAIERNLFLSPKKAEEGKLHLGSSRFQRQQKIYNTHTSI